MTSVNVSEADIACVSDELSTPLPGIDLRIGRASTNGNDALYTRLLRMFSAGQRDVVAQFRAASVGGDAARAIRLVHNLRTVTGSLGMSVVSELSGRIEKAYRVDAADPTLAPLLDQLDAALGVVLTGLRALDPVASAGSTRENPGVMHPSSAVRSV